MSVESDNAWIERYRICSIRGRYWTRSMLISWTRRKYGQYVGVSLAEIRDVVDDDAWMSKQRGYVPAFVMKEIVFEALFRKSRDQQPVSDNRGEAARET